MNKKTMKIIALILTAASLFSFLPMLSFAEDKNIIPSDEIVITSKEPKIQNYPNNIISVFRDSFDAETKSEKFAILNRRWIRNDGKEIDYYHTKSDFDYFEENYTYKYALELHVNMSDESVDYFFDENNPFIIFNGKKITSGITVLENGRKMIVEGLRSVSEIPKQDPKKVISLIDIENAALSYNAGDNPRMTAKISDKYKDILEVFLITWSDNVSKIWCSNNWRLELLTDGTGFTVLNEFEKGKTYSYGAAIWIKKEALEDGWRFADEDKIEIRVNGKKVTPGKEGGGIVDGEYYDLYLGNVFTAEIAAEYTAGDTDGDKKITVSDARSALRFAVALDIPTTAQLLACDTDGDGVVAVGDARNILRAAVGLDEPSSWKNYNG